ncbi:hypothetical protein RND71_018788 [Anisodus tanguticus]|uniref:Transmembrane 9 superfamily member n=1 Tax=Anisodus tanguticus TaxID=243964 RepID=A0AAE1VCD0_9SOLA|nr:hypothetical protein RND71_018788 [Anisodus tanguticus]
MEKPVVILIFTTVIMSLECLIQSDASTHRYKGGDEVPLYANKFVSDKLEKKNESLGEVLNGDRLTFAPYKLEFLVDKDAKVISKKRLTKEEVAQFRTAVTLDYFVQMYYDDLPIWAFLGKVEREGIDDPNEYKSHIFTFYKFDIYYHKDRVIEINLRTDLSFKTDAEEFSDNQEETGWKSLHGDVFRYPKCKYLLSSVLGCGTQIMVAILSLGVFGVFQPYDRGVLPTALVIIYAITSAVTGFSAVSFYHQLEGSNWLRVLLLTGGIFSCPLLLTFFFLNTVAINYGSTAALPSGTIVVILLLWVLLALPSLVLGAVSGKRIGSEFQAPCHTTKCPREVPPQPWYRSVIIQMALAGVLPFAVIYIELYYIFASVRGHRIYTMYSILFIVFILLLITTALVSIAMTYFQLAREDHQWWWRPVACHGPGLLLALIAMHSKQLAMLLLLTSCSLETEEIDSQIEEETSKLRDVNKDLSKTSGDDAE